ncbi:hypothetical protein RKE29_20665 [Streptomyces sp. B1866]|uniref:hypothetical protein n=1 Tax=Streptomyces sp. B1866 TaxID=3075431 RepID=UPI00288D89F9|nr:hypothetical protein [Streptomyces sp. B1866]MDT3399027.1 hypothetical protein [Streptomyces sp. B1866]
MPELELLRQFDGSGPREFFASGFELTDDDDEVGEGYSEDPEFARGFLAFAANSTGSRIAFWRIDDRPDPSTLPIVAFGDEGGISLVARSLRELFQLLACDMDLWVYPGGLDFVRWDEDAGPSQRHGEYVAWLEARFGLAPASDPNAVVEATTAELGEAFDAWMARFGVENNWD